MNDVTSAHGLLTHSLRQLIASVRETRQRVLSSTATNSTGPADEEAVHDFRVALRRCRTTLRSAEFIWSAKRISRIDRELRYFGRTTGTLRDDEVLRSTLASMPAFESAADEVRTWLASQARTGRTQRRTVFRIVRQGPSLRESVSEGNKPIRELDVVLDKLERLLDTKPRTLWSAHELAVRAIERALRDVRHAACAIVDDESAMHTLRIREKRLRYTAELFANELGKDGARLVSHATRMQRRLGDLHDLDEAITTITRTRDLTMTTQSSLLTDLRAARATCAAKVDPLLSEARQLDLQPVSTSNESPPNSST